MVTQSFLPPVAIAGYVSSILVIDYAGGIANFTIPLFANGSPTLVFHTVKAVNEVGNNSLLKLYGQTITPGQLCFNGPVTLIAYFLNAHAIKSLFGVDANELTNNSMDASSLKQARDINLQEQLLNKLSVNGRMELINNFIWQLLQANNFDLAKLTFATNALKNNTAPDALSQLQSKLNTSERSLQRLFEANVGISPRMFKRVWQFHAAFQQVNQYGSSKLTDVAYAHGFADQSHFIRVFKEFTRLTPTEYLRKSVPYDPKF